MLNTVLPKSCHQDTLKSLAHQFLRSNSPHQPLRASHHRLRLLRSAVQRRIEPSRQMGMDVQPIRHVEVIVRHSVPRSTPHEKGNLEPLLLQTIHHEARFYDRREGWVVVCSVPQSCIGEDAYQPGLCFRCFDARCDHGILLRVRLRHH